MRQYQPEVVTFGETMGLLFPTGSKGLEYSPLLEQSFGGAESNLAIGLARLGHRIGWFGLLGSDPIGNIIEKRLRGEGVDVSRSSRVTGSPTGLMLREAVAGKTSVYYYRKFSAASTMTPAQLDESYIAGAKLLHITGITTALSDTCRETVLEAVRMAKRNGVKVCFDPNLRLKLWTIEEARETLLPIAKEADYFLPGLDELKLLYDTDDTDRIFGHLHQLGSVCIVKGGEAETFVVENGAVESVPFFPVERVVDTVGAGDGFCAGFLAGVLRGMSSKEAVRIGSLIGAMVVQVEGDWQGLPTWEQVEAVLGNKKHVER
ncbi:sugar kinase [Paenibacillus sp. MBLB4367]|uniref:sugar kinase n=1 Tax=Paenibacillus sp. MBLB4367 TaxID=3384767 RepID=UPI0039083F68